ncbi:hypothetical protein QQG55_28910 [Brugia pahangi]
MDAAYIIVNHFQLLFCRLLLLLTFFTNYLFQQIVIGKFRFAYISVTTEPKIRQIEPWQNELLANICGKICLSFKFFYFLKIFIL